jgi:pimeloyl-ACP methyl ester carboxylesterase
MILKNIIKPLLRSLARTGIVVFALLVIITLGFYFFQEKLIFYPQIITEANARNIKKAYPNIEEITITTADNINLKGWFIKHPGAEKTPLIIYFGGNAEETSNLIHKSHEITGYSLALMNYRGYGLSEGTPSEKNLFKDAINIYDYFSKRGELDPGNIILMGRSLGTGVAIYLATQRPIRKIILVSPYDSVVSLARRSFPYLPVSLILKHRFDSISRAPEITIPMLALIASDDVTVPPAYSLRLTEKWGGEYRLKRIAGANHNSIDSNKLYWKSIQEFLK